MSDIHERTGDHAPDYDGEGRHGGSGCHVHEHYTHRLVKITINGTPYEVTPGKHRVSEFKRLASVPDCDELAEVIHGKLHVLKDDAVVDIKGHEQFLASAPSCPSS